MLTCPLCNQYSSKQAGRVESHIKKIHETEPEELYIKIFLEGKRPCCSCKEDCNFPLPWFGWNKGYTTKYARGHNARVFNVFSDKEVQKKMGKKRSEGYRTGKYPNPMQGNLVAAAKATKKKKELYDSGKLQVWNKGLTKETSEKVENAGLKLSKTKKEMYADGKLIPWNKGLTKHNSKLLEEIAKNISKTVSFNPESSAKRFSGDEVLRIIKENSNDNFILLSNPEDYRNKYQKLSLQCKKCNEIQEKNLMMITNSPVCYNCHPKESKGQLEVFNFVKSLCSDAELSNNSIISLKELDIIVPSKKFAIEFNGLYFHSELCLKNYKTYHYEKTKLCNKKEYQLFHIFEDEWKYKREIVESMLRVRLNSVKHKFYARKCEIRELDTLTRQSFFEKTHISGDVQAIKAWGLFFDNNLVSAISIRKPFHKKVYGDAYEIARYSSLLNTVVVGGLGKLIKVVIDWSRTQEDITRFITYVDLEHGEGNSYEKTGFSFLSETVSKFWWTNFEIRMNRFYAKADKKRGMTQQQVAEEKGVVAIYGCPNKLFELKL